MKVLDHCVGEGDIEVCQWLLGKGASPDYLVKLRDGSEQTIMFRALDRAGQYATESRKKYSIPEICILLCNKLENIELLFPDFYNEKLSLSYLEHAIKGNLGSELAIALAKKCTNDFLDKENRGGKSS